MRLLTNPLTSCFEGIKEIQEIFQRLDYSIAVFQKESGAACIQGCGKCCETSQKQIEASVLEVLPLAIWLWQENQALRWLEALSAQPEPFSCVFYEPHQKNPGSGRCGVYEWRPLICRLFGFSARHDKYDQPVWVACRLMKNHWADEVARIQQKVALGLEIPFFSEYGTAAALVNPRLGQDRYPINEAIKKALELTGLRLSLMAGGKEPPDKNHRPPVYPKSRSA